MLRDDVHQLWVERSGESEFILGIGVSVNEFLERTRSEVVSKSEDFGSLRASTPTLVSTNPLGDLPTRIEKERKSAKDVSNKLVRDTVSLIRTYVLDVWNRSGQS